MSRTNNGSLAGSDGHSIRLQTGETAMSDDHRLPRAGTAIRYARAVGIVVALTVGMLTTSRPAAAALPTGPATFGSALAGFAPAGTGPSAVATDPATHT